MELNVKITGDLVGFLKEFSKEANQSVKEVMKVTAYDMAKDARRLAPVDTGDLSKTINAVELDDFVWQIIANMDYAPYMEFGTGSRFYAESEFRDIAIKYKGKSTGSYNEGLKRIRRWCQRNGIDPDEAQSIFYFILKNGLEPRPFMYPAFTKGRKNFQKDMNTEFKELIRKYNG